MVNGYVQAGDGREALAVFSRMQAQGVCPDDTVLVGVLAACAQLGALEHGYLKATCTRTTVFLGTTLVDMYAKCGEVQLGMEVFEGMKDMNVHLDYYDKGPGDARPRLRFVEDLLLDGELRCRAG